MKGIWCFLLICCFGQTMAAKELFYPVKDIPEELLDEAYSIIRHREALLEINSIDDIGYSVKEIITVLNSNGEDEGILYVPYDSNIKLEIITANFYDADGNLIKKVKKSEIYDQCMFDGFSLFNDARFKKITPNLNVYPYTVEYEYVLNFNGILDYPDWFPCNSYHQSVEYSNYKILNTDKSDVRIKENGVKSKNPENDEDNCVYYWEMTDFKALEYEPYAVAFNKLVPSAEISPTKFSYYEMEGDMGTWEEYGNWVNNLLAGKDELPEERKQYLFELTKDQPDELEKIKLVYEFLQQKTRYVSIQLGLGGYEPFSAQTVDEVGYGDCKALANYMMALLKSIGIKSYYTLVRAGNSTREIDPLFPSQYFNHVILTVPLETDTLFLECTNQFNPFGYLSDFTSDRYVLVIAKDSSKLVKTECYDEKVNTWNSCASVALNASGDAMICDTVVYSGLQYDSEEDELRKTKEKQIESAFKYSKITGAKYLDVSYSDQKERIPSLTRSRNIDVKKFATIMGDRMFLPINFINKRTAVPPKNKDRKNDFRIGMSYTDTDKIVYFIPEGYQVEYVPESKVISSLFGEYSYNVEVVENNIIYERKDVRKEGTFSPDKYMDFYEFYKEVVGSDSQKIILKKL